ncbi:MAG: DUF3427 domain-containing protein [Vulcanimicrobiota bacterium]
MLERSAKLQADLSLTGLDPEATRQMASPWTDEAADHFRIQQDQLICELAPAARELVDELVAWRLADYLLGTEEGMVCRIGQKGIKPAILLPARKSPDELPLGPTRLSVDGREYQAQFDRQDITLIQPLEGRPENLLPRLLRGWFGPEVGLSGTVHRVALAKSEAGWRLKPIGGLGQASGPLIGQLYAREQIPGLFGLPFNTGVWNKGYVTSEKHLFLLVTLSKTGMNQDHAYEDKFLPDGRFQWQSQNKTARASGEGRRLSNHQQLGISVHLFARKDKRSPFRYEGRLAFDDWRGDRPITVFWRLLR